MLKTNEDAREYFKPLTYEYLTEKNFNSLVAILTEVLGKWNRQELEFRNKWGHGNNYLMNIHEHKRFSRYPGTRFVNKNGKKEAFIIVKCDNYSYREGISFNSDGFIGFAGWADSDNVRPFLDAFEQWVDKIKKQNNIIDNVFYNPMDIPVSDIPKLTYKYIGEVEEFPESEEEVFASRAGVIYYCYNGEWHRLYEDNLYDKLYEVLDKYEECDLKKDIMEVLCTQFISIF